MSTAKKTMMALVLMAVATLVALLIGELAFRLFSRVDPRYYNIESTLWIITPERDNAKDNPFDLPLGFQTTRVSTVGTQVGFDAPLNRHGMRSAHDYTFERPAGSRRVMLLGDSVLFGHTDEAHRIPEALARALVDKGWADKVEVPNFSCPGWSMNEYLVLLQQAVARFEVDHVVVGLVWNDLAANALGLTADGAAVDVERTWSDPTRAIGGNSWLRAIVRHSALLTAVVWNLKGAMARVQPMDSALTLLGDDAAFDAALARMDTALAHLAKVCRAAPYDCTLAINPYAVQLDEDLGHRVYEQWFGRPFPPTLLERRAQAKVLERCRAHGLDCVDLTPAFLAGDKPERFFFQTPEGRFDYVHYSAEGNALVADVLAAHLAAKGR